MSFSERLKFERKRLKFTQKELAGMCGITEQAQVAYEKEKVPQFAEYLQKLSKIGFDTDYLVSGCPGGVHLTEEESELLSLIRKSAPEVRKTALEVLRSGMVITKQVNVGRDNYGDINL